MPIVESPIGHLQAVTGAQAADGQSFKINRVEADGTRTVHLAVCQNDGGWLVRWYKDADGRLQYSEYRLQPGPNEKAARGNEVAQKPKVNRPTIDVS